MECGECTLCCELFPIKWVDKPANIMCKHCINGCLIHSTKDKECTDFACMYLQAGKNIELRPDKSKVIFEKLSDNEILGTLDARFEVSDIIKKQINSFLQQGFFVKLGASDFRKPMIWRPTEQI